MWLWLKSRFRLRRWHKAAIAAGLVAGLWLFSLWPFDEPAPFRCAGSGPMSPAAQIGACYGALTAAWDGMIDLLCKGSSCKPPPDDAPENDAFTALAEVLEDLPLGWARPRLFEGGAALSLASGQCAVLAWTAAPGDARLLTGRVSLTAGASLAMKWLDGAAAAPADCNDAAFNRAADITLRGGAPSRRVGFAAAKGAALSLRCGGGPCRVALE
jgi:hypothetical protein